VVLSEVNILKRKFELASEAIKKRINLEYAKELEELTKSGESFAKISELNQKHFKNTFKVYLSTVPFTIFAAFLESYVTRFAIEMGALAAFSIIFLTLGVIVYYYLVYPIVVQRKLNLISKG
jgi:hypothetical protein